MKLAGLQEETEADVCRAVMQQVNIINIANCICVFVME